MKDIETIKCEICGVERRSLVNHIIKIHNMTPDNYKQIYNVERVMTRDLGFKNGSCNPAFGHGGKYSPHSKNFIHGYNEEKHLEFSRKQSIKMKEFSSNIPGYGRDRLLCSEDDYIRYYGAEEGPKRFVLKYIKRSLTMNSKTPEEIRDINRRKTCRKGFTTSSKPEFYLYENLKDEFNLELQYTIENFIFDLVFVRDKKIIEFNGDFWHCNPEVYNEDYFHPLIKKSSRDIWNKDKRKAHVAHSNGYDLLVVWEKQFKMNPGDVLKTCREFLNG